MEGEQDTITEHFRCECGHQWLREMENGLVAIVCPTCRREHLTNLGLVYAHFAVMSPRRNERE